MIQQKKKGSDLATGSATGYHIAFYVSSTATHVRLLGGNQSDSVKYGNFSLSAYDVKGYAGQRNHPACFHSRRPRETGSPPTSA